MSEITLKRNTDVNEIPFIVNLENETTGEKETYKYFVKRLGGKAMMKVQMLNAEFARDKDRNEIVGSSVVKEILDRTRPQTGTKLDLIEIFDFVNDDQFKELVEALVKAAQSSTVTSEE